MLFLSLYGVGYYRSVFEELFMNFSAIYCESNWRLKRPRNFNLNFCVRLRQCNSAARMSIVIGMRRAQLVMG